MSARLLRKVLKEQEEQQLKSQAPDDAEEESDSPSGPPAPSRNLFDLLDDQVGPRNPHLFDFDRKVIVSPFCVLEIRVFFFFLAVFRWIDTWWGFGEIEEFDCFWRRCGSWKKEIKQ